MPYAAPEQMPITHAGPAPAPAEAPPQLPMYAAFALEMPPAPAIYGDIPQANAAPGGTYTPLQGWSQAWIQISEPYIPGARIEYAQYIYASQPEVGA